MKRKFALIICLTLLFSVFTASCGRYEDETFENLIGTWESTLQVHDALIKVMDEISESPEPFAANFYNFEGIEFKAVYTFSADQSCTIELDAQTYEASMAALLEQLDSGNEKLLLEIQQKYEQNDNQMDETAEAMLRLSVYLSNTSALLHEDINHYAPEIQTAMYDVSLGKLYLTDYATHEVSYNVYELEGDTLTIGSKGLVIKRYEKENAEDSISCILFPQVMCRLERTE